ncbi:hypothetical protein OH492_05390 [Vibrio chagasii]|nr:hypothetical protein [Vibrio chagasii]
MAESEEDIDSLKQSINPLLSEIASLSESLNHAGQKEQAPPIERMSYGKNSSSIPVK